MFSRFPIHIVYHSGLLERILWYKVDDKKLRSMKMEVQWESNLMDEFAGNIKYNKKMNS